MAIIEWDPSLETGDATIDSQHKKLFSLVNTLRDACVQDCGDEVIGPILDELAAYVGTHFSEEQALMARARYPVAEIMSHTEAHVALTRRTEEIITKFRAGQLTTVLPLTEFLFEWLRTHIRHIDRRLVDHIKAGGTTPGRA